MLIVTTLFSSFFTVKDLITVKYIQNFRLFMSKQKLIKAINLLITKPETNMQHKCVKRT